MTGFLRRLFDLREGEGRKASLMFGYGMLIIATVVILKSVSNSLFVDSQGAGKLPYVFMLVALFDDEPRVATATTLEGTRVLRVDKEDFIDLLADYVAITQSILKTMVKRLRRLMTSISR